MTGAVAPAPPGSTPVEVTHVENISSSSFDPKDATPMENVSSSSNDPKDQTKDEERGAAEPAPPLAIYASVRESSNAPRKDSLKEQQEKAQGVFSPALAAGIAELERANSAEAAALALKTMITMVRKIEENPLEEK